MIKKIILDPQGKTVANALSQSLGFAGIHDVRIGKCIKIKMEAKNKKEAEKQVEDMCKKLLSNPIIEEYAIQFEKSFG